MAGGGNSRGAGIGARVGIPTRGRGGWHRCEGSQACREFGQASVKQSAIGGEALEREIGLRRAIGGEVLAFSIVQITTTRGLSVHEIYCSPASSRRAKVVKADLYFFFRKQGATGDENEKIKIEKLDF